MTTITQAYGAWAIAVNNPPAPDIDEATDILQQFAPTLSDADGNAWWDAVAATYESLGIINQPTYTQLRNEVNQAGAVAATDLFDALISRINSMPESVPVNAALQAGDTAAELAAIPDNIIAIEALKIGGVFVSDQQFDAALDQALIYLQALEVQLS